MFITGDHGEQTAGGHLANVPEAWTMPLVMVGPGIKKGVTFDYTESIDTVPMLRHLMGVNLLLNADGTNRLKHWSTRPPAWRRANSRSRRSTSSCSTSRKRSS